MKPIPSDVKRSIALRKLSIPALILLGGLFCIGKYFVSLDYYALFMLGEDSPVAEGRIIDRWEEDWDDNGNVELYGYEYGFYTQAGEFASWVSYSPESFYKVGDKINIRYNEEEPKINRAIGMSNSPVSVEFLGIGIFLIIVSFSVEYFFKYFKTIRILENSRLTYGKLIGKHATDTEINDQKVYKMFFRFNTHQGEEINSYVRTHNTYKLEDDPHELLAYDENEPENIVLIDLLPETARKYFYEEFKEQEKEMS